MHTPIGRPFAAVAMLGAVCTGGVEAAGTGYIFVSNESDDTVSVVDG